MPYTGNGTAIGIGEESTWGTAVSRTHWFRAISENLKRTVTKSPRPVLAEASGSRNRKSHYIASDMAGGSFEVLVGYEGFGLLLKHILGGTPATTGSSAPYTHTYKLAASPPTGGLTIEVKRGNGTAEVFEGCRITKATFKIEAAGLMRVSCDVIAETSGGRTSAGTPSYTTDELDLIHHQAGSVGWNSNLYVPRSVEITIDNKFATRQLLGSKLTKEPKPSDFLDVTIKLDLEWENDNLISSLTADDAGDLTLSFTGLSSRTFTFTAHNAFLEDASDPISGVGVVAQSASFRAQSDGTDEGLAIVIENTQSSAVAA